MEQKLTGTQNQIEWAEQIKPKVNAEFDRVSNAFREVASRQPEGQRIDTLAVIAILEEKRLEVMTNREAGYFILHWQELSDQVRQMIAKDPRYRLIKANRALPKNSQKQEKI